GAAVLRRDVVVSAPNRGTPEASFVVVAAGDRAVTAPHSIVVPGKAAACNHRAEITVADDIAIESTDDVRAVRVGLQAKGARVVHSAIQRLVVRCAHEVAAADGAEVSKDAPEGR